jgi:hypothetical protein
MEGLDQPTTAEEINRLHRDLEALAIQSLDHAIRIGELLSKVKTQLPHGRWIPWLNSNVKFSERTARNYMRVFENRAMLKSASVADLGEAYQMLIGQSQRILETNSAPMTKAEAEWLHKRIIRMIDTIGDLLFQQFQLHRTYPELSNVFPETAAVFEQLSKSRTDNEFRYHLFCHILRVAGRADLADLLPVPL